MQLAADLRTCRDVCQDDIKNWFSINIKASRASVHGTDKLSGKVLPSFQSINVPNRHLGFWDLMLKWEVKIIFLATTWVSSTLRCKKDAIITNAAKAKLKQGSLQSRTAWYARMEAGKRQKAKTKFSSKVGETRLLNTAARL